MRPCAKGPRSTSDGLAALSTRGQRRTVDAGHAIQIERTDVVIAAIEEVLEIARSG